MTEVWSRYHLILIGFVVALPVAALAVLLRARALTTPARPTGPATATPVTRHALWYAVCEVAAVYGTLPWLAMTLTPDPDASRRIQPLPLDDLASLVGTPAHTVEIQLIGNLLVFAAAGFFLPVRFDRLRSLPRVVLLAALGSVLIETVQYVADLGRVSSVDDVLVNAVGAGLFALASRPLWPRRSTVDDVDGSGRAPARR
ncbi:VanZ family protein [Actinocatenispora sera]|uniref:VanZ family protein n=1 Tax=Actinocatenispora sera TaxID=390989 RepID=UPI00340ACEFA